MRRLGIVVLCSAAVQLMIASPAHAWWGWLDELSGPGPWMFVDGRYRIYCVQDGKVAASDRSSKNLPAEDMRSLNSFDKPVRWLAAIGGVGCVLPSQWDTNPRASVNFSKGFFVAVANNPRPEGDGHLAMVKYEFTGSTFLDSGKIFELNAGGGWLQGRGKSEFTRGYWTVTGDISPYAALMRDSGRHSLLRTITVNIGVIVVPKGFTARDFAAPGPFRSDGEILKTISITLDFSRY